MRVRLEPWMANVERLRQIAQTFIRTFRKYYIRNPLEIVEYPSATSQFNT